MPSSTSTSSGASPVVELRGLRRRFGAVTALAGLDLVVPRGATYGLLGPNGAGKTTTIRMLLRIIEPDAGEIRLFGEPVTQRALDRVGYLPEERGLYRRMRVRRLLSFLAEIKGIPPRASAARIGEWLERFELADRADARLQELSKGNQQKIQFIGSVLHEPELVILDEPFSGLDVINQQVLKEIVQDLKHAGRTILFCTHMIGQAEKTCDHVCILAHGERVVDGTMSEVRRGHGGSYVALRMERWTEEARDAVRASPAVASMREEGSDVEVTLRSGADAPELLRQLVAAGLPLTRFEEVEPSLERIFLDRVGADAAESWLREQEVAHV